MTGTGEHLIDALPANVALIDARGVIIAVNGSWRRFAASNRYAGEGAGLGRNYLEICRHATGPGARDASQVGEGLRAVLDGAGESFVHEYPCHAPDHQRWFEVRIAPLRDGAAPAALIMHIDVTSRHRQAEQLRDASNLLRIASRMGRTGGWILRLPGREAHWSDEICLMLGYPPGVVPPVEESLSLYSPDSRQRIVAAIEQAITGAEAFDIELDVYPRQGGTLTVRCRGEAVLDAAGRVVQVQGVFQDISDERERRSRLELAEERFRLIAQAGQDAIWDWDLEGGTVWWHSGLRAQSQGDPQAVASSFVQWAQRVHPEDRERVTRGLDQLLQGNESLWREQYLYQRVDGKYCHISAYGWVLRDADGKALRMLGGMRDITERRELEEQLRQAQRLESIGKLTGGIAHDFNNLLTVMLGNAELLAGRLKAQPELQAMAERILQTASRGADLTQRLLAFARRQPLQPRITDLNVLIAGMDDLLRRALGESVEIEFARAAGLWRAMVDPSQLENSLLNLCLNARDAMPQGGRITIETGNMHIDRAYADSHGEVMPGQYVLLAVSDTGCGIPPELIPNIFEPFVTTKEAGKGTGLGLSMVYGFIKQSRGHVSVYSELGQGTTVRLYLPRAAGDVAMQTGSRMDNTAVPRGSESILLVEDNELVREFAHDQLALLGYRVYAAAAGPEALQLLASHPDIALLFTDVVLAGGMSGPEVARAAQELRPGLPVLYTSGYTENAIIHHGRVDPDVELLSKPYRSADLAHRVRLLLDGAE